MTTWIQDYAYTVNLCGNASIAQEALPPEDMREMAPSVQTRCASASAASWGYVNRNLCGIGNDARESTPRSRSAGTR